MSPERRPEGGPMAQPTATEQGRERKASNAYDLFILVLTVLSLLIMAALLLPLNEVTTTLLTKYDNMICVVFLIDFASNLSRSHPKREYVVRQRGWLDLLGSIPTLGIFKYTALLRLARITRLLRGKKKKELAADVLRNRGQYAAFITVLAAFIVLTLSSVLVLQFETT